MKTRLFTLLLATLAVPALAQQKPTAQFASNKTAAPAAPMINFESQKFQIDSVVQIAEGGQFLDHASFRGKAREGKYWVECFYNKKTKEILKANYIFTTDSTNFSKCFYFKNNSVVKVFDNNTTNYYQVGNVVLTEQGTPANAALAKKFSELITDTFQALHAGLFP
ncbi:hypothetical protein [Niastella sp. OAS944]|uniref:hypothetical protein n=1 Tax=Niastella sp. OAS944 TaxID=2664089 RepID=UPI0035C7DDF3|nr:hypothetical protein [Chitinophagaceae bacterium OAS944]